jgi:hypothetical protein
VAAAVAKLFSGGNQRMRRAFRTPEMWFLLIVLALWIVDKQGNSLNGLARADPQPDPPAEPAVGLQAVKWADLAAAVRARQGKVLVVDVWAEY